MGSVIVLMALLRRGRGEDHGDWAWSSGVSAEEWGSGASILWHSYIYIGTIMDNIMPFTSPLLQQHVSDPRLHFIINTYSLQIILYATIYLLDMAYHPLNPI